MNLGLMLCPKGMCIIHMCQPWWLGVYWNVCLQVHAHTGLCEPGIQDVNVGKWQAPALQWLFMSTGQPQEQRTEAWFKTSFSLLCSHFPSFLSQLLLIFLLMGLAERPSNMFNVVYFSFVCKYEDSVLGSKVIECFDISWSQSTWGLVSRLLVLT